MEKVKEHGGRVVLVPLPFQGHLTPMLQLGSILHSKGFSISIAHTEFNAPDPSIHPNINFLPLPVNFSGHDNSLESMTSIILSVNTNCTSPLQDYVIRMLELDGPIASIIYDSTLPYVAAIANHLNLPSIVLQICTPAFIRSFNVMLQLHEEKLLPLSESRLEDAVPVFDVIRFKDLPYPVTAEIPEPLLDYYRRNCDIGGSASAVIWNTVDILDHSSLIFLGKKFKVPFFSIGPLHKVALAASCLTEEEDNSCCIEWLDKQSPHSVLYVSMGSMVTMKKKELIEMAWGLANSEQPFLWATVPDPELIEFELENITQGRGRGYCIVKWAPQKRVLAHPAVGGFWSHAGWNSILESMCEGVPILCKPNFGDQMVNARYVTRVWKVGIGMEDEDVLERGSIEKAIRTLMLKDEGKEVRQRARQMKKELELSVQRGGSSYNDLDNLKNFIISLTPQ